MNFQAVGGRRFVLAIFVYVTSAVLLWFGKLSDGSFCTITLAAVIGLITGHTYENVKAQEPKA
jgi:hypothetical protein